MASASVIYFPCFVFPYQRVTSLCCTPDSVLTQTILDVETDEAFYPAMGGSKAGALLPGASFGAVAGEVDALEAVGFLELFFLGGRNVGILLFCVLRWCWSRSWPDRWLVATTAPEKQGSRQW